MSCTQCELHSTCKTIKIDPDGKGDIVFLGEAPGAEEDQNGIPFIGKSGKFLRAVIEDTSIARERIRFTNAVRCRPPENKTPTKKQIRACLNHLIEEFIDNPPSVIVPLGNVALEALRYAGILKTGGTITSLNGRVVPSEEGVVVFPTLHPAYILRNQDHLELYVKSFNDLDAIINEGVKSSSPVDYRFSDSLEDLREAIKCALQSGIVSYDIETSILHPKDTNGSTPSRIISFSLSWKERQAFGFNLTEENRDEALKILHDDLLENPEIVKVIQHAKFELIWSMSLGRTIINIEDTMLMHWHVNEKNGTHGLGKLALEYTDMGFYDSELENYKEQHKEADPKKSFKDKKTGEITRGSYANIPSEILLPYNCSDTDATLRVRNAIKPLLSEKQIWTLENVQIPACYPLAEMELEGASIDWDYCSWLKEEFESEIERISSRVFEYPEVQEVDRFFKETRDGKGLSLSSPVDLRTLLFDALRLPVIKYTDGGFASTDKDVLDYLSDSHEITSLMKTMRRLSTLNNTFVVGAMKRRMGNRIHTSYGMAHTETGRYNSTNPNMQNIPRDPDYIDKEGEKIALSIKGMYIPDTESAWIAQADYSQVELRVMAILSGDQTLLGYFRDGLDVHRYVAAKIHKLEPEKISSQQRTMAKRTVFGLIYGQSAQGLSEELNIPLEEAEDFLSKFFNEFPKVKLWMDNTERSAHKLGYVETLFGRIRRLPDCMIKKRDDPYRRRAMRQAINGPVQGTAGDILAMKKAELWIALKEANLSSRIILTVHDQMLFHVPEDEFPIFFPLARKVMEDFSMIPWVNIPICADFEIGRRWSSLRKLKSSNFEKITQGISPSILYDSLD